MAQDIDLTSPKWTALIFEGKNKKYGAYELRNDSSNRHLKALAIVAIVGLAAIYLPNTIRSIIPKPAGIVQGTDVELSDLNVNEVEKENQIQEIEPVPPPPLLKSTVQYTPMVAVDDEQVVEQKTITMDELTETDRQISVATAEGTKDGVDIRDLTEHKVITEVHDENKIWESVEQSPEFPGGINELYRILRETIDYPPMALEQGISGTVTLRFVVRPDGSIDDVKVWNSLERSCDMEAVAKVKKLPKFIPGKMNGHPVSVYFVLPIRFQPPQ